jgi:ABC-type branched-subunit amino acid transport system permease subunit
MTPPKYSWLDLGSDTGRPLFFLAFAVFLFCAWVAYNFKQSRTGRGFFSLRDNEKAAATFGVELTRYRLLAFMLSGGIAALAGVVFALRRESFAAIDFPVEFSIILVAMVIIGGLGSISGAALGAIFLFGANRLLQEALGNPVWVPYAVSFGAGIALILVLTRARGGLAGLLYFPRDPVVTGMLHHEQEFQQFARSGGAADPEANDTDARGPEVEETRPLARVGNGRGNRRSKR